jgi:glutamyl-tRNA synthetase
VRTALFNWLFARHHKGAFILRIEDTDRTRYREDVLRDLLESLRWLGINWDEGPEVGGALGPYFQSQRLDIYQEYARKLLAEGQAYECYCSPERLARVREEQQKQGKPPGYDRHCRSLTDRAKAELEAQGIQPVIRLKVPPEGQTSFHDMLRGDITFNNSTLDDLILLKSDGYPTYHLANVIDDTLMEISHVMRAQEWIPSTPRHILIYKAFGWKPPVLAHLPVILVPEGGKLSKRNKATPVHEFRGQGYLPEALVNFLALIGWSPGESVEQEVFTRDELIERFNLSHVNRAPGAFSSEKLDWMNGIYIRQLSREDLLERLIPVWQQAGMVPDPCPEEVQGNTQEDNTSDSGADEKVDGRAIT